MYITVCNTDIDLYTNFRNRHRTEEQLLTRKQKYNPLANSGSSCKEDIPLRLEKLSMLNCALIARVAYQVYRFIGDSNWLLYELFSR